MKKNLISIILIVAAVGLCVLSWFVLPSEVVVQISTDGEATNTLPKLFAVLVPFGLSTVGAVINICGKDEMNKKALVVSAVGIVAAIMTLLFNL